MKDNLASTKTILVSGANIGIGKATAEELARRGATVIMACRNLEKAEAAAADIRSRVTDARLELLKLDLSSRESIKKAAEQVKAKHERLDVLINNAGIWCYQQQDNGEGIELTWATNHLGTFLFTHELMPLLKTADAARIVTLSSALHERGKINWEDPSLTQGWSGFKAYCQSKLANALFTFELAQRLEGTSITANCVHPGVVRTQLGREAPKWFQKLAGLFFMTPEKGAATSVHLATSPEVEGVTGKYFANSRQKRASKLASNAEDAGRLWKMTEEKLGVKFLSAAPVEGA